MTDIKNMNYVEFISFLKETNRCPGGKDTIQWILKNSFANANSKVLEVGSNTGFSSLEVARTVGCTVIGIDPVAEAVHVANEDLSRDSRSIRNLVEFRVGSAYNLPCKDDSMDLIIAGGSTSFMDKKQVAVKEMERVLRPWGLLSVTNLFYHTEPPRHVLDKVSEVIGVKINPMSSDDWINTYLGVTNFELYKYETATLEARTDEALEQYIEYFMKKPHIVNLPEETKRQIYEKWLDILQVFNENHKYLGFIKALLRKRTVEEEPELFKV